MFGKEYGSTRNMTNRTVVKPSYGDMMVLRKVKGTNIMYDAKVNYSHSFNLYSQHYLINDQIFDISSIKFEFNHLYFTKF